MTDRSSAPFEPHTSGSLLAEKYRLEREIGRGAMGTVWLATHVTLDQQVAIKIISREHAHSAELRQRFGTEARAAAKLRSRYVVGVYDHGETPDALPFIVMEYLEGECLEDRLARDGLVPVSEAVRVTRHVGRALARAHANGIVHRDLKPANIFITHSEDDDESGWTAKVLDFGVAKMDYGDKSATKTGTLIGTPLFMSPEQVRGASNADHRSDLYSLGMVVYNMVTGQYAFDKATFGDLLISICTDPLPKLRSAAPWAPEGLEDWFQKACARAPEDRFADADEMLRALDAVAGSLAGRRSIVDLGQSLPGRPTPAPPAFGPLGASAQAETVPGALLPNAPVPTPPSSLSSSSISSAGAASVTVNFPPARRSLTPWAIGLGVAALAAVALAFAAGGSNDGAASVAGQAASSEELRPSLHPGAASDDASSEGDPSKPEGPVGSDSSSTAQTEAVSPPDDPAPGTSPATSNDAPLPPKPGPSGSAPTAATPPTSVKPAKAPPQPTGQKASAKTTTSSTTPSTPATKPAISPAASPSSTPSTSRPAVPDLGF